MACQLHLTLGVRRRRLPGLALHTVVVCRCLAAVLTCTRGERFNGIKGIECKVSALSLCIFHVRSALKVTRLNSYYTAENTPETEEMNLHLYLFIK